MGITNSLIRSMLKQCRKPAGFMGTLMAWGMNSGHSEVTDWGLRHIQVAQSDTVLDVGCGGGATVKKLASLASRGKVYGIDYSDRSVAIARRTNARLIRNERVDIRQGSVSSLPFSENTFDLVTAVETHYFCPDLVSDMQEVRRVLKPGGTLMIIGEVYKGGKESDTHRRWIEQGDMAYLSLDELGHVFAGAGFHDVQVFEECDRGWMCGMGQKLLSSFH